MALNELTIAEARRALDKKEFSSLELTQDCLKAIEKLDGKVKSFLATSKEQALEMAKQADQKISHGEARPLTGIPLGIKDIILIKNSLVTAGSKILENYRATYDATVIQKLKEANAVFLGRNNLDEFAMGSSTENSAYQKTKNPWDLKRVPGGSSGGSAAAVAAQMCLGSLGTDTGGSIRQPASFCGVVGLKPTYGRVSRFGLMAMASSLDQIGPLTKTVMDAAVIFKAISGFDEQDKTTVAAPIFEAGKVAGKLTKGMKIGIPKEYFIEGMDEEIRRSVEEAIKVFRGLGLQCLPVSLPLTKYALAVYYLTVTSEISANMARYDGIRYGYSTADGNDKESNLLNIYAQSRTSGFGQEVKRRIIMGTYALSAGYYEKYYSKAQRLRRLIAGEFQKIFKEVDCLVTPTSPSVAFKLEEKFEDPLMMYLSDIYTVPANIGGICALSMPCGFAAGLPVGLQLMAGPWQEEKLMQIAHQYEQSTEWHKKQPKLAKF